MGKAEIEIAEMGRRDHRDAVRRDWEISSIQIQHRRSAGVAVAMLMSANKVLREVANQAGVSDEAGGMAAPVADQADLPLRLSTACLRRYSICPLTLRSSSCAQASSSAQSAGFIRKRNALREAIKPDQV